MAAGGASAARHVGCAGTKYTVRAGDTCASIAAAAGMTVRELRAANPRINRACSNLQAGQRLCLVHAESSSSPPPSGAPNGTACTLFPFHRFWGGGFGGSNATSGTAADAIAPYPLPAASAAACQASCAAAAACLTFAYDASSDSCHLLSSSYLGTTSSLATLNWTSGSCHGGAFVSLPNGVFPLPPTDESVIDPAGFVLATLNNATAAATPGVCPADGSCGALRAEAGGRPLRLVRVLSATQQVVSGMMHGLVMSVADQPSASSGKILVAAEVWSRPWLHTRDEYGPPMQITELSYMRVAAAP